MLCFRGWLCLVVKMTTVKKGPHSKHNWECLLFCHSPSFLPLFPHSHLLSPYFYLGSAGFTAWAFHSTCTVFSQWLCSVQRMNSVPNMKHVTCSRYAHETKSQVALQIQTREDKRRIQHLREALKSREKAGWTELLLLLLLSIHASSIDC